MNPYDIAAFLSDVELPYVKERHLIKQIHHDLAVKTSLATFEIAIDHCVIRLDSQLERELQQLRSHGECLMGGVNPIQDMAHYLKVITLKLLYTEAEYVKLKLRTLLKLVGYKRRGEKVMSEFDELLDELNLLVFVKGELVIKRVEIGLDDFMTIRLRS